MTTVKRDFVLMVELFGKPHPQDIVAAIAELRREAEKEFGLGFTETADVVGPGYDPHHGKFPTVPIPCLIFRAYPPKGEPNA